MIIAATSYVSSMNCCRITATIPTAEAAFFIRLLRRVSASQIGLTAPHLHRLHIGPYPALEVHVSERREFMTEAQEKQALYPRPETPRLYGQEGKLQLIIVDLRALQFV
jgi:hypothetical protein